jgi:hypothetical protein
MVLSLGVFDYWIIPFAILLSIFKTNPWPGQDYSTSKISKKPSQLSSPVPRESSSLSTSATRPRSASNSDSQECPGSTIWSLPWRTQETGDLNRKREICRDLFAWQRSRKPWSRTIPNKSNTGNRGWTTADWREQTRWFLEGCLRGSSTISMRFLSTWWKGGAMMETQSDTNLKYPWISSKRTGANPTFLLLHTYFPVVAYQLVIA